MTEMAAMGTSTPVDGNLLEMSRISSSSCSKIDGVGSASPASIMPSSGGAHCSLGHGGGAGLGPVMEIREVSPYCNSCIPPPPDKYYHHPGTSAQIGSGRHSAAASVYHPQVFYTPPPPPAPSAAYATSNVTAPPDWSCPPSGPESFSHFIYPHHHHHHHQYSATSAAAHHHHHHHHESFNFLSMPPTATFDSDLIVMPPHPPPDVPPPSQLPTSFIFPPPPPQPSTTAGYDSLVATSHTTLNHRKESRSTSDELEDDVTEEGRRRHQIIEEDDDRQVISIEDDDNSSQEMSWCVLCRKPAPLHPPPPSTSVSHHCSSPQLAKILENIDDDELDISVCSGDIEIGGIEDEMMQQVEQSLKVTCDKLGKLLGVRVCPLVTTTNSSSSEHRCEEDEPVLCSKCHKLVTLAESLEKQQVAVLSSLKEVMSQCGEQPENEPKLVLNALSTTSISTQTDVSYDSENWCDKCRIILACEVSHRKSIAPDTTTSTLAEDHDNESRVSSSPEFLCHECGRSFGCGRNLGKHLDRHHSTQGSRLSVDCTREDCSAQCPDSAALRVHMRVHNGDKPFFCSYCFRLFTTKSNLTAHITSGACPNGEVSPKLSVSEDEATSTRSPPPLQREKTVTFPATQKPPPLRCENCGLSFRTERRFQRHLGPKRKCGPATVFECGDCLKRFAKRSELQAHQVVHTKSKCFPCNICGLAFTTRGNQRVHQRAHFQDKRFKCHWCDKSFTRNQTLRVHISNTHRQDDHR